MSKKGIVERVMRVKPICSAMWRYVLRIEKKMNHVLRAFAPVPFEQLPYFESLSAFHQLDSLTDLMVCLMCNNPKTPFLADIHSQSTIISLLTFHLSLIRHEIDLQERYEKGEEILCKQGHPYCDCMNSSRMGNRGACSCLSDHFDKDVIQNCSLKRNKKFRNRVRNRAKKLKGEKKIIHMYERFAENNLENDKKMEIKEEVNVRQVFSDVFKRKKKMKKRVQKRMKRGRKTNKFDEDFGCEDDEMILAMIKQTFPFHPNGMKKLGINKFHPKAKKHREEFTENRRIVVELFRELWYTVGKNASDDLCLYKDFVFWKELLLLFAHESFFDMDKDFRMKREMLGEYRMLFLTPVVSTELDRKRILLMLGDRESKKFEDEFNYDHFNGDFFKKTFVSGMLLKTMEDLMEREENRNKKFEDAMPAQDIQMIYLHHYFQFMEGEKENPGTLKKLADEFHDIELKSGWQTVFQVFKHPKQIRKSMVQHIFCAYCQKTEDNDINMNNKERIKGEVKKGEVIKMKKCGNCKVAGYCSTYCQKKDWKKHKLRCDELALQRKKFVRKFDTIDVGTCYTHFPGQHKNCK